MLINGGLTPLQNNASFDPVGFTKGKSLGKTEQIKASGKGRCHVDILWNILFSLHHLHLKVWIWILNQRWKLKFIAMNKIIYKFPQLYFFLKKKHLSLLSDLSKSFTGLFKKCIVCNLSKILYQCSYSITIYQKVMFFLEIKSYLKRRRFVQENLLHKTKSKIFSFLKIQRTYILWKLDDLVNFFFIYKAC